MSVCLSDSVYLAFSVEFNIWLRIMKLLLLMFPPPPKKIIWYCINMRYTVSWSEMSASLSQPIKCHKYNVFRKETPLNFSSITSSQFNQFAQKFQHL